MSRKKLLQNLPDRTVLKRRALAKERVQQYNLFSDLFMSVALDVLAEDSEGQIFNIEVQRADTVDESQGELSQRVKYLKTNPGGIQMFIDKMDINYLEGREEGREENALKSAQKMLAKKICTDEEIAEITELPLETILRLKAQLSQTQAGTVLPVKKI